MTDNHPITPPPELVQQWDEECDSGYNPEIDNTFDALKCFASKAAQWGSDQELEACCDWLSDELAAYLRDRRRPGQPGLKEQALQAWAAVEAGTDDQTAMAVIRRALEQLDE